MYKSYSKKIKKSIQKKAVADEKLKGTVQKPVQAKISQQTGNGRPLPDTLQADMEARSGASLDSVNIHTGPQAAEMADQLGAKAFTTGNDIFFNSGYYAPQTSSGQSLIEHELNHVLQQRSGEARGVGESNTVYDAMEAKADQPIEQHAQKKESASAEAVTQREPEEEEVQMAEEEEELQAKLIQREEVEEEEVQMAEEEEELQAKLIQREEVEEEEVQMAEEEEELQAKLIQLEDVEEEEVQMAEEEELQAKLIQREDEVPNGLSLGVDDLTLDISPFNDIPARGNLDHRRLFQLSPDFIEQLTNEWRNQYLFLHSGPTPVGNEWDQVWAAWRRLANAHIARGEIGPVNPLEALEDFRQPAADAVIAQLQGGEQDEGPDVAAIAENVGKAFELALNATQFYPRWEENATTLLEEHWPRVALAVGTALSTSIGFGVAEENWEPTEAIGGLLLDQMNDKLKEIELSQGWQMSLSVNDLAIANNDGRPTFNLTPQAIFTYQTEHVDIDFGARIELSIDGSNFNIVEDGGGSIMFKFKIPQL